MIETERLYLRNFLESDIDDYFELVSKEDVLPRVGAKPYKTKEEAKKRLEKETAKPLMFAIVLKENGKVVGNIAFNEPKLERFEGIDITSKTKELGCLLSSDFWGQGIMPEATNGLLDWGFSNDVIDRIVISVKEANSQSVRVIEKVGFKKHSKVDNYGVWINNIPNPINPDNAWILRITAAAGTELADPYSYSTFSLGR